MGIKTKLIVGFVLLEILDFMPLPTTSIVAIYIILKKPCWFKNLIMELYSEEDGRSDRTD